jgi:hypothetical protein
MAQQEVPNTSGQREFERAQLITSSKCAQYNSATFCGMHASRKGGTGFGNFYIHFKAPFLWAYKKPMNKMKDKDNDFD